MRPNLLILAGTTEATASPAVADRACTGTCPLPDGWRAPAPAAAAARRRVGGVAGLAEAYLRDARITHVIDATHPFAAQMSRNAVAACAAAGVPLVALTRPALGAAARRRWIRVPDIAGAVAARPAAGCGDAGRGADAPGRVRAQPAASYLLRLVDPPAGPLPLPEAEVIVDRGPFDAARIAR